MLEAVVAVVVELDVAVVVLVAAVMAIVALPEPAELFASPP